jgi:RimJ/RimL family protein N-acetyltransferase
MTTTRAYPQTMTTPSGDLVLRLLTCDDEQAVLAFAQKLAMHDLLFLRRDISNPRVVAAWMNATRDGSIVTIAAFRQREGGGDGDVLGCATIVRDELGWSSHVCELRVLIAPELRGQRVGQRLTPECFALALEMGLEKMVAQMTVDQRGAIAVFEGLGFRAEALLRNHVKDQDGNTHHLVVLSHDVARFAEQMEAYGLNEAWSTGGADAA